MHEKNNTFYWKYVKYKGSLKAKEREARINKIKLWSSNELKNDFRSNSIEKIIYVINCWIIEGSSSQYERYSGNIWRGRFIIWIRTRVRVPERRTKSWRTKRRTGFKKCWIKERVFPATGRTKIRRTKDLRRFSGNKPRGI